MVNTRTSILHKVYLQSLLSRRAMTEDVALEMYKRAVKVCEAHDQHFRATMSPSMNGFRQFRDECSRIIEDLGMEIKSVNDEVTGTVWVVLVNTDASGVALQATDYSALEVTFFRNVVSEIILSYPNNSIGSRHALRLASELEGNMSKGTAEMILNSLVSRRWLQISKRGRYSLAPRALAELESYLKQEGDFEELMVDCARCRKLVLTGKRCSSPACETHFHAYCYDTLFSARASCPGCSTPLARSEFTDIGEKAVRREEDDYAGLRGASKRRRTSGRQSNGSSHRRAEDGDDMLDGDDFADGTMDNDEGEDGLDESGEAVPNRTRRRMPAIGESEEDGQ